MAALYLTNETRGHYNYLYARVPAVALHTCVLVPELQPGVSRVSRVSLKSHCIAPVSDDGLGVISAKAGSWRSPEPSGFSILHLGPGRGGDMSNTQKRY